MTSATNLATVTPLRTPDQSLIDALYRGDLLATDLALKAKASIEATSEEGLTPILIVTAHQHKIAQHLISIMALPINKLESHIQQLIDLVLERNPDLDATDGSGATALHHAVKIEDARLMTQLLKKGANPHARNRDGKTPAALAYEARSNHPELAKVIARYA